MLTQLTLAKHPLSVDDFLRTVADNQRLNGKIMSTHLYRHSHERSLNPTLDPIRIEQKKKSKCLDQLNCKKNAMLHIYMVEYPKPLRDPARQRGSETAGDYWHKWLCNIPRLTTLRKQPSNCWFTCDHWYCYYYAFYKRH